MTIVSIEEEYFIVERGGAAYVGELGGGDLVSTPWLGEQRREE